MQEQEGLERDKQIEDLLVEAKTGDNTAINSLWSIMEGHVRKCVENIYYRKMYFFDNNGLQIYDLQQEAYFAFRRAIETYNRQSADDFRGWVWVIEKHWMLSLRSGHDAGRGRRIIKSDGSYCIISANPIDGHYKSFDEKVSDDEHASTWGELIADPESEKGFTEVEERDLTQMLRTYIEKCLAKLPKDERKVLRAKYYANLSDEKVAKLLGIPIRTMTRREQVALYRLRSEQVLQDLYNDFIIGNAYHGTGLHAFVDTGASVEERIVERMEGMQQKREKRPAAATL